jgi:hypothetical protein
MLEPEKDRLFIRLITDLAEPSALPDAWTPSPDSDSSQSAALKSLYRLGSSDSRKFLTVLNTEAPPHETTDAFLNRVHKAAAQLLPHLVRKYQELVRAAAIETEHEKFIKVESEYDPFLEDTNNLTRDAYSGRAEIEPETPVKVDGFGNCVRD